MFCHNTHTVRTVNDVLEDRYPFCQIDILLPKKISIWLQGYLSAKKDIYHPKRHQRSALYVGFNNFNLRFKSYNLIVTTSFIDFLTHLLIEAKGFECLFNNWYIWLATVWWGWFLGDFKVALNSFFTTKFLSTTSLMLLSFLYQSLF